MDIKKILAEVKRGCAELIDEERIEKLIKNYYEKGENFFIKAGFDPTAPDLHLGHSVVLTKMAFLQKHGAIVQFLIGDFDENEFDQLRKFMKLDPEMKLSQLSRGMREKLIIALTFARKADLYLLDEPFGGIDAMARKKIINSIILWKDEKATILISDHFVNEISSLLDEVVIVKDHTVLEHKSADDIRQTHKSIEEYYESFYADEDDE